MDLADAIALGDQYLAEKLIQEGANPLMVLSNGETPFDISLYTGNFPDVIEQYIISGTTDLKEAIERSDIQKFNKYKMYRDRLYKNSSMVVYAIQRYDVSPNNDSEYILYELLGPGTVTIMKKEMTIEKLLSILQISDQTEKISFQRLEEIAAVYLSGTTITPDGPCQILMPGRHISGGMYGQVKRLSINGTTVAVKEGAISNLVTDANVGISFSHPSIMKVERIVTSANCKLQNLSKMSLVQEYYPTNLRVHVTKGDISVSKLTNIMDAIGFLERQGIVYTDLKPENILVSKNGDLVLGDLGGCWYSSGTPTMTDGYRPVFTKVEPWIPVFMLGLISSEIILKKHILVIPGVRNDAYVTQDTWRTIQMDFLQKAYQIQSERLIGDILNAISTDTLTSLTPTAYMSPPIGPSRTGSVHNLWGKSSVIRYLKALYSILKSEKHTTAHGVIHNLRVIADVEKIDEFTIPTLLELYKYVDEKIPMTFTVNSIRILTHLNGIVRPHLKVTAEVFYEDRDPTEEDTWEELSHREFFEYFEELYKTT
jgi:serine/threonine protein kinase